MPAAFLRDGEQKFCRDLEVQLEEAVTLAEEATRKRREAETQLVTAEARAEAAAAHSATSDGGRELELRNLRDELAAQEAAVREARRLKEHARCPSLTP